MQHGVAVERGVAGRVDQPDSVALTPRASGLDYRPILPAEAIQAGVTTEMSVYLDRKQKGVLLDLAEPLPQHGTTRRPHGSAAPPIEDTLYSNERFDDRELDGKHFVHCTFANVSFLRAKLRECHFTDCVFEGCYFRSTEIRRTFFRACKFIASEFHRPIIQVTNFEYVRFDRSIVPFESLELSLPGAPNLCQDLTTDLARQATLLGRDEDARSYRLHSIAAYEQLQWRAATWADDYSRSHYPNDLQRVGAFGRWLLSKMNGVLWGHGERIGRLVLVVIVLTAGVFPGLLFGFRGDLHSPAGVSTGDVWLLSLAGMLNSPASVGVTAGGAAAAVLLAETLVGLVFFGLFVAYLFRRLTRR